MAGLSYAEYRARTYLPALDGLRAFAVMAVVLWHLRGRPFGPFQGYRGVWVFFVISGYLITTLSLREEEAYGTVSIRAFMTRRVHRILPLYYVTLAFYCVWVFVVGMHPNSDGFVRNLPAYLLYVQEFPIFSNNFELPFAQSWSLGIEELFYVVWPVLAFSLLANSRLRAPVTAAITLACFGLTLRGGELAQFWGSLVDILAGCLLAFALHHRPTYDVARRLGRPSIVWALVAMLGAATLVPGRGHAGERVYMMLALVTVAALVVDRRGPSRLIGSAPMVWLGRLSYGIYLMHAIGLDIAERVIPSGQGRLADLALLPVAMALVIPVCMLLYRCVEQPLIARGRRVAAGHRAPTRPVPALDRPRVPSAVTTARTNGAARAPWPAPMPHTAAHPAPR